MKPLYNLDFKPQVAKHNIHHGHKILFLGSCFSEHISNYLKQAAFQVDANVNGIVFNPTSLLIPINHFLHSTNYKVDDIFKANNGVYYSWYHHGKINGTNAEELLTQLTQQQLLFNKNIESADWLFVTFGSALAYRHIALNMIVANCHKMPQSLFNKEWISLTDIISNWRAAIEKLLTINNKLQIVFTVSPVKYLRDGLINNTHSKAILHLAIRDLLGERVHYFPSYELVTDDLRDYRFFESDGAHPNNMAIDYVWDKMQETYFTTQTSELISLINSFKALKNHKPIIMHGTEYEKWQMQIEEKRALIMKELPHFEG